MLSVREFASDLISLYRSKAFSCPIIDDVTLLVIIGEVAGWLKSSYYLGGDISLIGYSWIC